MKNKLNKALAALLISAFSISTLAQPALEEQEYNYKLKHNDWVLTHRSRENTYHFEVGKKIFGTEYTYRYADLNGTIENRIKLTTDLYSYKDFSLKGRTEFRSFDNKESHWRVRLIAEYNPHLYGNLYLFTRLDPRWALKDAGTVFDSRDQLGITYKGDNWKITPFIERNSTEGYRKNMILSGIYWEAEL